VNDNTHACHRVDATYGRPVERVGYRKGIMRAVSYFVPHLVPLALIAGLLSATSWTLQLVGWIQLSVPFLDQLLGVDDRDPGIDASTWAWRVAIWTFVPVNAALIGCALFTVTGQTPLSRVFDVTTVSLAMAVGAIGGMFGVPVAHELMHQRSRWARLTAELQMLLMSYPHFCIEHVHGHHRNVGTRRDPATARFGESVYRFYPRTVFGGVVSAWRRDRTRMVSDAAMLIVVYLVIFALFDAAGVLFFMVQSVVGFSSLEVINFIEHYGLTRREVRPGCHEPVGVQHAWNSSHRLSNLLLFNVARHSDHHCDSARPYASLRHLAAAPQLPARYFAMFMLALIPPLWHRVMDPRVEQWRHAQATSPAVGA
jgi:alkane 1-monooxygenase